jgi:hypothetical protein
MRKKTLQTACCFLIAIFIFSCKKDKETAESVFFGKWKASYGDTIEFRRVNGKNILNYDRSLNPTMPLTTGIEYSYRDGKLGIKDGLASFGSYRVLQSFKWLDEGRSFEVQGVEWFVFLSSTGTYFTFTKIP